MVRNLLNGQYKCEVANKARDLLLKIQRFEKIELRGKKKKLVSHLSTTLLLKSTLKFFTKITMLLRKINLQKGTCFCEMPHIMRVNEPIFLHDLKKKLRSKKSLQ